MNSKVVVDDFFGAMSEMVDEWKEIKEEGADNNIEMGLDNEGNVSIKPDEAEPSKN